MGPYEGMLKMAIHGFKYRNQSTLASPLGELLSLYGGNTLNIKEYGLIIPVPLHFSRLRQRGFNQSLMLARKIGEMWNIKVSAEILIKLKHTTPQTMLSYKQRQKNVRGVFACRVNKAAGKKVLLIDDVYTSGSTVDECARVLKKNGSVKVDVLTLARTI
jgi:ComF family protein